MQNIIILQDKTDPPNTRTTRGFILGNPPPFSHRLDDYSAVVKALPILEVTLKNES